MRCFFKNESFACENEYRIVLKIPEEFRLREENSMFELGIRELLWQNKMEDVHIFSSGIPIRKYS